MRARPSLQRNQCPRSSKTTRAEPRRLTDSSTPTSRRLTRKINSIQSVPVHSLHVSLSLSPRFLFTLMRTTASRTFQWLMLLLCSKLILPSLLKPCLYSRSKPRSITTSSTCSTLSTRRFLNSISETAFRASQSSLLKSEEGLAPTSK